MIKYISIFQLVLRCLLVARQENLTGFSTGLTGRSKNLDPTGNPTGRSTRPVSISNLLYCNFIPSFSVFFFYSKQEKHYNLTILQNRYSILLRYNVLVEAEFLALIKSCGENKIKFSNHGLSMKQKRRMFLPRQNVPSGMMFGSPLSMRKLAESNPSLHLHRNMPNVEFTVWQEAFSSQGVSAGVEQGSWTEKHQLENQIVALNSLFNLAELFFFPLYFTLDCGNELVKTKRPPSGPPLNYASLLRKADQLKQLQPKNFTFGLTLPPLAKF